MATWPSGIGFLTHMPSLRYDGPEGDVAAFGPDVGPPKLRRRTTAAYRRLSGATPILTATERATFLAFWETDLAGGVLDFTATHPFTGQTATFRSDGRGFRETLLAPGLFRISLGVFEVPS